MKDVLFWVPIALFSGLMIWAVIDVLRSTDVDSARKYAVGTQNYGVFPVFATIAATFIGPTYTLGVANNAFQYGWMYTMFFFLSAAQLIVTGGWLLPRIAAYRDARTVADIFVASYGPALRPIVGLFTVAQALVFTGVLALGGGTILSQLWDIPQVIGVFAVAGIATGYTALGGFAAVLKTDEYQFVFMVIGWVIAVGLALTILFSPGNETSLVAWNYDSTALPLGTVFSTAIAFLLGEALIPIYSVRGIAARTPAVAKRAFKLAGWFGMTWFAGMTLVGLAARGNTVESEAVLISLARGHLGGLLGAFLLGLLAASLLAVVMSTFDSVLNVGAVSLVRDCLGNWLPITESQELRYTKFASVMLGFLGILFVNAGPTLVSILLLGYNLWVPTIVPPLAWVLLERKRPSQWWVVTAIVSGGVSGYIVDKLFSPAPIIPGLLVGLLCNVFVLHLGASRPNRAPSA